MPLQSVLDPEVKTLLKDPLKVKGRYHPSPEEWESQVIYFLLPDRFSDNKENSYLDNSNKLVTNGSTTLFTPADHENALKNPQTSSAWLDAGNVFCGGTIAGIISKLGYLKRLGVTAIWIGPVFKQVAKLQTYHGYGIQDFLQIDSRFGTKADFVQLVSTAHSMGMYVIADIILNHVGNVFTYDDNNPGFSDGRKYTVKGFYDADRQPNLPFGPVDLQKFPNAYPDGAIWPKELQKPECFHTEGQISHWDTPREFLEGDFFDLKDLNLGQGDVENYQPSTALRTLIDVFKYWVALLDLDGFRIDTVKHMGDGATRTFAQAIREFARGIGKHNFMLVGEVAGGDIYRTVRVTGLDAALGLGGMMPALWQLPQGKVNAEEYFSLFRNEEYEDRRSKRWVKDKVFTMIDDHDQIWRGENKGRYCSSAVGPPSVIAALGLNITTLGIPCVYYGTEQSFDGNGGRGSHPSDQYIRECMFGGNFGPFRSYGVHCFDEQSKVYQQFAILAAIRKREQVLRNGRQYLREISGDGNSWGTPHIIGSRMLSIVAWSRIFNDVEALCAMNTDVDKERSTWVTVDNGIQTEGAALDCLYPAGAAGITVVKKSDRLAVQLTLKPGGFVIYKST